jgi:hypothetical protein
LIVGEETVRFTTAALAVAGIVLPSTWMPVICTDVDVLAGMGDGVGVLVSRILRELVGVNEPGD